MQEVDKAIARLTEALSEPGLADEAFDRLVERIKKLKAIG